LQVNARAPRSAARGDQNTHATAAGFQSSAAAWVETDGAALEEGSDHGPLSTVAHQPGVIADSALPLLRVLARIAQRCATTAQITSAQDAVGASKSGEGS
jgi:hypothetical protein